jgi:hypothetical protein
MKKIVVLILFAAVTLIHAYAEPASKLVSGKAKIKYVDKKPAKGSMQYLVIHLMTPDHPIN